MVIVIIEFNGLTWLLSGIYVRTDYRKWRILWEEVTALIEQGNPTMVAGNFNCVLGPEDKRGGIPFVEDIALKEFWYFLQMNGLLDLGFVGP